MPNRWFKPNKKEDRLMKRTERKRSGNEFSRRKGKKQTKISARKFRALRHQHNIAITTTIYCEFSRYLAFRSNTAIRSSCPSIFYPSPEPVVRSFCLDLRKLLPSVFVYTFILYPGIPCLTHPIPAAHLRKWITKKSKPWKIRIKCQTVGSSPTKKEDRLMKRTEIKRSQNEFFKEERKKNTEGHRHQHKVVVTNTIYCDFSRCLAF
ncbi:hypothetical protein B9Z55_022563 [Caenorhabditis nigoni]|uniref:Uncharacterized protein n=1 Tax=Caenorhabditis nigoni TaxID=1611254 RepID=A0A2G5SL84_9PELO|nr:hypothetical protein B9Z55_022563 [Caenorhabditis nigoni]